MSDIVSVIIPVYNSEKYLRYCLDSVVNQSYKDIEIIIVDDGSKDNSSEILDEYVGKYPGIKAYHNENRGVSFSRNFGIDRASGDYLLFHDSDDWLKENAIEGLVKIIGDSDVACGTIKEIWPHADVVLDMPEGRFVKNNKENGFVDVMYSMHETSCAKLYRKDVILKNRLKFDEDIRNGEDAKFIHDFFSVCSSVVTSDIVVDCYNKLEENTSVSKFYKDLALWRKKEAKSRFNAYLNWSDNCEVYISNRSILYYSDIFDSYLGSGMPITEYRNILTDVFNYFDKYIVDKEYRICDIDHKIVRELLGSNPNELVKLYDSKHKKNVLYLLFEQFQDILRLHKQKKYTI